MKNLYLDLLQFKVVNIKLLRGKSEKNLYLEKLYNSNKPLIIYKVKDGYNLFTDFSEKIKLNKNKLNNFFKKIEKLRKPNKNKSKRYICWFFWI